MWVLRGAQASRATANSPSMRSCPQLRLGFSLLETFLLSLHSGRRGLFIGHSGLLFFGLHTLLHEASQIKPPRVRSSQPLEVGCHGQEHSRGPSGALAVLWGEPFCS